MTTNASPPAADAARQRAAAARIRRFDHNRRHAQRLVALCEHLEPEDAALVRQVYETGTSVALLSRMTGSPPGRLYQRLRRLERRMLQPRFAFVVTHMDLWQPRRRDIASSWFLRGRSIRRTARELGVSLHRVRKEIEAVRTLFEEARRPEGSPWK